MDCCSKKGNVVSIDFSGAEFEQFISLPWMLYKENPYWIPPLRLQIKALLNPKKNPFFKHSEVQLFLAYDKGRVVGRIAAILNQQHNRYYSDKIGFFGLFECIDDKEIARALLDAAASWLSTRGMTTMRGPTNLSTNDECGLLIDGFGHSPYIMMTYNPAYYVDLMDSSGLIKAKDLFAYYLDASSPLHPSLVEMSDQIRQRENVLIRNIDLKRFDEEIARVRHIYNDAWSRNWGFVPMTEEEFSHKSKELKEIIEPSLAFIAEVEGTPVGFGLTIPNMNDLLKHLNGRLFPFGFLKVLRKWDYINSMRALTLGMVQEYQGKGLGVVCYVEIIQRAQKLGCARGEMGWILEDNEPMNKAIRQLGSRLYKKYRLYDKSLSSF